MTKVMILPVATEAGQTSYLAVAGDKQSFGITAGAALDALTTQLPETEESTLVILPKMQPDCFFSATQQQHLTHLMEEWRTQHARRAVTTARIQKLRRGSHFLG